MSEPLVSFQPSTDLSEQEKADIDAAFDSISTALTKISVEIKELPRDEAFRRMNILVREINFIPESFTGAKREFKPVEKQSLAQPLAQIEGGVEREFKRGVAADRPNLMAIVSQLDTERVGPKESIVNDQERAMRFLDCVKNYEEYGADVVCPECNPELMLRCINTADTTIRVEPGAVSRQG